uniref:Uncharacterized protein n=1 Tax=Anguilla anguilla TaxID=7936 RepID=A0A0E9WUI9_ANGAN
MKQGHWVAGDHRMQVLHPKKHNFNRNAEFNGQGICGKVYRQDSLESDYNFPLIVDRY